MSLRYLSSVSRPSRNAFDWRSLSPAVIKAEYAVRGAIVTKADEIKARIAQGEPYPFENVIGCNIGNPYVVGKKELTFPRQLIAATECQQVRESGLLPPEVVDRAKEFLAACPGGLGAYTHSQGVPLVRKHVAEYIEKRDGFPADPNQIFLLSGASQGVTTILKMLIAHDRVGIMTPFPTYPLYTAEITLDEGRIVPYYLDEDLQWGLQMSELLRAYKEAVDKGTDIRALVVINPGNPTGSVMTTEQIKDIIDFCERKHILIIADEVYQANTYNDQKPFVSFKAVASTLKSKCQIVSLHSISKGFFGECGHRGGYMELLNVSERTRAQLYKLSSISLSPNAVGQLLVDLMVKPPESPECKPLWEQETQGELDSMKMKARRLRKALVQLPGIKCQPADGAMYLFPKLELPPRAIKTAAKVMVEGKPAAPDMFWSMELLNETGIVVVPGSGFGQVPGTFHFRLTFLPVAEKMDAVIERISRFQPKFMERFSD